MEFIALAALIFSLGLAIGYECGVRRRKRRAAAAVELPDYDMNNFINQSQRARTIVEDGVVWTVYGGRR